MKHIRSERVYVFNFAFGVYPIHQPAKVRLLGFVLNKLAPGRMLHTYSLSRSLERTQNLNGFWRGFRIAPLNKPINFIDHFGVHRIVRTQLNNIHCHLVQ